MATGPAPAVTAGDTEAAQPPEEGKDLEQRIRAYRELYDERHLEHKKHREKMLERYAERQNARAERFDAMLKQHEAREAERVKEQEKMLDRYTGERDYLSEHHQELLQMALERKEERIKRHEELRKQAEERQAEIAKCSELEGLSPEERSAYIDERMTEMSRERQQHRRAVPRQPHMAGPRWQPPPPARYPGPPAGR
jgi:hypothetical protein